MKKVSKVSYRILSFLMVVVIVFSLFGGIPIKTAFAYDETAALTWKWDNWKSIKVDSTYSLKLYGGGFLAVA